MDSDAHAMISIHSSHANSILDGSKTVELRRRFMKLPRGSRLWIYSTLPVGAVVATATIEALDYASPAVLWERYQTDVAVSEEAFLTYFDGCPLGCAIKLRDIQAIAPISLNSVRQIRGIDHIPKLRRD